MARAALAGLLGLAGVGGCILVTGSNDGYVEAADAATAATPNASACDPDASVCVVIACTSAKDCASTDGGAPGACCLTATTSPFGANLACQPGPCDDDTQSVACVTDSDCTGEACQTHACTFSGTSATFATCGDFTCPPSF